MKALFTLLPLAITCFTATARQLSVAEAYALGTSMVPASASAPMMSINSVSVAAEPVITMSEGEMNTVYAFNRAEGGYVVVAADDEAPVAVLGWSDKGSLPAEEDMPENMKWLFENYSANVAASKGDYEYVNVRRLIAAASRSAIAPMLTTTWGQLAPYNAKTPVLDGQATAAGCVSIAVAQVMNYFRYPMTGAGSKTYTTKGVRCEMDFSSVNFAWDKMAKKSFLNSTDAEANDAISTLVYAIGVSAQTTYGVSASTASMNKAAKAMITNFGYDQNLRLLSREYYSYESWMDIIYSELQAGRPVLYTGTNSTIGHAFIADGYTSTTDTEYLHINWGWNGTSDGYFAVMAMNPSNQGVGGSTSGYNASQTIVVGIQPAQEDTYAQPVPTFTNGFSIALNGSNVKVSDPHGIILCNYNKAAATFGVRLTNADGREIYVAENRVRNLINGSAVMYYEMDSTLFPTEGTWTVSPAVCDAQGNWITDGLVKMSKSRTSTLIASADGLTFINGTATEATATEVELLSPVFSGQTFGLGATLTTEDDEYFQSVSPALYKDGVRVATAPSVNVQLYAGESKYFEWVGKFNATFTPGQYTIALIEADGSMISTPIDVTVEAMPAGSAEIYMAVDLGNGINGFAQSNQNRPEEVSFEPLTVTVYIECVSGYYAENIAGVIFQGSQQVVKLPEQFVGIKAGETAAVTFEYEGSDLQNGVTYTLKALESSTRKYIGQPSYFRSSLADNDEITVDAAAAAEYVQFFNLNGVEVSAPTQAGIYVAIAADGTAHKIAIR
ncbi:MAG: C10 family peptidase [Paramuribaculum sp.]|nr:C10 family peptidase [Paramuribaculum sp.]